MYEVSFQKGRFGEQGGRLDDRVFSHSENRKYMTEKMTKDEIN